MSLDWTKPLATRYGEKAEFVRELRTDDEYPMLVIVTARDGSQEACMYRRDGTYAVGGGDCGWDLQNIVQAYELERFDKKTG